MTATPDLPGEPRGPREPRKVPAAGDADAVPDTPYVPARGTEPNSPPLGQTEAERRRAPRGATQSRGMSGVVWVVLAIAAIAAAVYFFGM